MDAEGNLTGLKLDHVELCECLFQDSHDAILLINEDRVLAANSRMREVSGYDMQQLTDVNVHDIVRVGDEASANEETSLFAVPESGSREGVLITATGDRVPVALRSRMVNASQQPYTVLFARDVSSEKQVRVLKAIQDNAADGIVVVDQSGKFQQFNPAAEKILGYGPSDVPMGERAEYYGTFRSDGVARLALEDLPLKRALQGEDVRECEILIRNAIHTDGIWCSINASPLRDESGVVRGAVGSFRDITARRQAEQAIEDQGEFIEAVAKATPYFIYVIDVESLDVTYFNRSLADVLGYAADDELPSTLHDILQLMRPGEEQHLGRVVGEWSALDDGEVREDEYYFLLPNGSVATFLGREVMFESSRSNRRQILGTAIDISERKSTEQQLRDSQAELELIHERLALAITGTSDGVWDWDVSTGSVWMSPRGMELLGRDSEEWTAAEDEWRELIHPEDRGDVATAVASHFEDGTPFDVEMRMLLPDGEDRCFNFRGIAVRDETGEPVRMSGALRDITDSRAAAQRSSEIQEESIRAHNQLVEAIESLTEGFALYDSSDRLVICNSKYRDIYDISRDLLVPGAKFEDHIRESAYRGQVADAVGREEEWVRERVQQHQEPDGPYVQQLGNGRWLQVSERKTREGGIVGVRTDITDRVVAEESLRTSEAMFRGLTESSPALVAIFQGTGHAYVNPEFTAYLGYSQRELLEMSFLDYVHPDDRDLVRQRSLDRQEGKQVESRYEIRLLTRDGKERWTDFGGTRVTFNGAPAVLGVALDITKQRRAEKQFRESEERYRTLLENHADGVMVVVDGRIEYVNSPMCDMCGQDRAELVGRAARDVLSAECDEYPELGGTVAGGNGSPVECEVLRKSGESVAAEVVSRPIRLRDDDALLLVVRDVSWRKRMEEEAHQHRKLLARANRVSMLGELATGLAHELNQPLGAIAMLSDASQAKLASGIESAHEIAPILSKLSMQSRRAGEIVDRIRQFIGKEDFVRTPYPIAELVDRVLTFLGPDLREHECVVETQGLAGLPDVDVDRVQIEQVLVNLIHNSIDAYVESGIADRHVVIRAEGTEQDVVALSLTDFGPGMSKEAAGKVFEAFYSTKAKGMGMGLAICRSIIESHRGRIDIEAEPGAGVTFRFTLPVAQREVNGKPS